MNPRTVRGFKAPKGAREPTREEWTRMHQRIRELMKKEEEKPLIFRLNMLGTELTVERYPHSITLCDWDRIRYLKDGREVYRLMKPLGKETRREYFFGRKFRQWKRDRFCFVEYSVFWQKHKRFPNTNELARFGLERRIADCYEKLAQRIAA